ncbi:long-chain-fatty-acid--CoA ligase [Pseudoclavibacter endophyticus]|uniref:Acyl-CoA synthetase n=1 Tax=Pseudoclavibacter endophyticus TaxID=1778590 RepID=A0A6H9WUA7_9MICO|nr:AMP-dependent synthetase/ligase [Pseudoclavibacter endophyticus]KAB1650265.1 AMP-binding protein [Pseudoclavibacter endophyticus]GGA55669.1 long-chain-fatty-acid--CoA ligase [Pseudoclavibacter endophyticus]
MQQFEMPAGVAPEPTWNTTDLLLSQVRTDPEHAIFALPDGDGWRDVTAAEFHRQVAEVAKGLIADGVEPGDHIAFIGQTSYEWTLVDFALWFAGAIMVPIYETSSASQIGWIIEDSGAKGLITHRPEHDEKLSELGELITGMRLRYALHDDGLGKLRQAGASVTDETLEERRSLANADDVATLIYTSGSTGRPKGCVLTHSNFVELSRNVVGPLSALIHRESSTVLFITLAHIFARFISVLCVYGGVKVGHQHDTTKLVEALGSFKPSFLLAVPRVFEKVYNSAEHKAEVGGRGKIFRRAAAVAVAYSHSLDGGRTPLSLKLQHKLFDKLVYSKLRAAMGGRVVHAVSGSAPLGDRLSHFYRAIGMDILEGYGLTETTAPISVNRPEKFKIGTVGPPLPGVSVKISDEGEIFAKGINIFREYWKNPDATAESFEDGWFKTGDLGTLDEDGYITVTGRSKEIIVTSGGKNVAPAVLEDPIRAHPIISQVVVVGDQRPFISALVTLDPEMLPSWLEARGQDPDLSIADAAHNATVLAAIQEIVDTANSRVSRAESIRKFVVLDDDFTEVKGTLTPKLSIKRHAVLERYEPVIKGLYDAAPPTQGVTLQ